MVAQALTAAALAGPVLGAPVTPDQPSPDHVRVLNQRTLKPIQGSPSLPNTSFALAPGRRHLAAATDDGVEVFRIDRREPLHRVAFDRVPPEAPVLSWSSPDRLLVFQCVGVAIGDPCGHTTVRVVDPAAGRLIRTVSIDGVTRQVSRTGRFFLLAQAGSGDAQLSRTLVVDEEGAVRHRLDVAGYLNGPLIARTFERPTRVYRVDAGEGRVTARRVLRRFDGGNWAAPPASTTFLRSAGGNLLLGLDGRTFRTRRPAFRERNDLHAVPGGYVVVARTGRVTRADAGGRVRWTARATSSIGGVVGPSVYVQEETGRNSCQRDPRFRMRVLDARTGRRVDLVNGAFFLTVPPRTVSTEGQTVDGRRLFCDRG